MAGFQVSINGRIWVSTEAPKGVIGAGMGLGHRRLQAEPGFEQPTGGA